MLKITDRRRNIKFVSLATGSEIIVQKTSLEFPTERWSDFSQEEVIQIQTVLQSYKRSIASQRQSMLIRFSEALADLQDSLPDLQDVDKELIALYLKQALQRINKDLKAEVKRL